MNLTIQNRMYASSANMTKKANTTAGKAPVVSLPNASAQSNPLVDKNYNSLLLNNNTAFTGKAKTIASFGKDIGDLLFKLEIGDVCLITKRKKEGVKLMEASLDAFGDIELGSTVIMPNAGIENTFAVRRISNRKQEIINLADEPIVIHSGDGETSFEVPKGAYLPLIAGDSIMTKKGAMEIPLMKEIGFNKSNIAKELDRFAEDGPIYKVGYGPREVIAETKEAPLNYTTGNFTVKGFGLNK